MELLIPGLALVALMVWASTRIKRTAADAFAPEVIDTPEFSIKKPEGWLSIAVPTLPFEAYTKDYAPSPNEEIRWRATWALFRPREPAAAYLIIPRSCRES